MLAPLLALSLATASKPLPANPPQFPANAKVVQADPASPQSLRLSLALPDRAALDALIAAQHDPRSPSYRRWLTPAEFGERFGQPLARYEALAHTLEAAGLKVTRFPNRIYLEAVGSTAQVQKLLGVKLVQVSDASGTYRSFQGTPSLPADQAGLVQAVFGLDNRARFTHRMLAQGRQSFGPQDLRRYYNVDALHLAGFGGQLSKIAVVGSIPSANNAPSADDVNWFYRNVSDSTAQFVLDQLPLGSSQEDSQPGLRVELEMDAEMPTVAAPLAQSVTMVLAPADSLFVSGYNEIINNQPDTTSVSVSFGSCELLEERFIPGEMQSVADVVAQGVAEGIAFFSASGDYGVLTCLPQGDNATQNKASVDFPSSAPYMTAVGGTMYTGGFDANDAVAAYGQETTWNEGNQIAGGGGVSNFFAQPVWQVAPGTSDAGFREVPDIALLAATEPGVVIVDRAPGQLDPSGNGTSDAAPLAAGIFAVVNDRIGGCRLGTPNFVLYALGRGQYGGAGPTVFHDITTGNLSLYDSTGALAQGPDAGPGYDEATGLGSLDVAALAEAWPPCAVPGDDVDGGSPADAGGDDVDAGPQPWDGGYALDAGPRAAYDACAVLACPQGSTCTVTPEGPASCLVPCDPAVPDVCGAGNYCATEADGGGFCLAGCNGDSDCSSSQACSLCSHTCIGRGNDSAHVGDGCQHRSDCPTGGTCLSQNFYGMPGGYCTVGCSDNSTGVCGCPSGSVCQVESGICFETCQVSTQQTCRDGYVCDPSDSLGSEPDQGVCLPNCNTLGGQCFGPNQTCDTATGLCLAPGDIGSIGTSGSTGSDSSSGSGSTGGDSTGGDSGSSGSGASSSDSTAGSSSGGDSGGTGSAGTASGSSGSSSGGDSGGGCGCGAAGGLELPWGLVLAAGAWLARRRVRLG